MKALISMPVARPSSLEKAMLALLRGKTFSGSSTRAVSAAEMVKTDRAAEAIISRAAATVATTTDAGFSAELMQPVVSEFLGTLAPFSAAARLIGMGLAVPIGHASEIFPTRNTAPTADTQFVGEGNPISARGFTLNSDCALAPKKFALIVAFTREVARRANGETVMRTLMREEAAATLDATYFGTRAKSATDHAGMLNGLTSGVGYGGGDRLAMQTDLTALSNVVAATGSGQVAFVVSPKRAARIPLLWPELKVTFLPSLAVPEDRVIGVDPAAWVHGTGEFDLEVSNGATLHMSDDADPIVDDGGVPADGHVRSMWSTDSIALRLVADHAFAPRKTDAVAFLSGATW